MAEIILTLVFFIFLKSQSFSLNRSSLTYIIFIFLLQSYSLTKLQNYIQLLWISDYYLWSTKMWKKKQ